MTIGRTARDHHEIGDIGQASNVQKLHFQSLHVVEGGEYHGFEGRCFWRARRFERGDGFFAVSNLAGRSLLLYWHYVVRFLE